MGARSFIDWLRLLLRRGEDPDVAELKFPGPMSHEESVALEKARIEDAKRRMRSRRR